MVAGIRTLTLHHANLHGVTSEISSRPFQAPPHSLTFSQMLWENGTQHQMGGNIIQFYRCANGGSRFSLITVAFVRLWAPLCQSTPTYLPKARASVSRHLRPVQISVK